MWRTSVQPIKPIVRTMAVSGAQSIPTWVDDFFPVENIPPAPEIAILLSPFGIRMSSQVLVLVTFIRGSDVLTLQR